MCFYEKYRRIEKYGIEFRPRVKQKTKRDVE